MTNHAQIERAAAEWLVRRHEPGWSIHDQVELDRWLAAEVAHKAAYWRLEYGYAQLDRLAALGSSASMDAVIPAAHPRHWRFGAAAMLATIWIVVSILAYAPFMHRPAAPVRPTVYATRVGQMGKLDLSDGSKIDINTDSRIRVAQGEASRELWLDKGEIFLHVAHEPTRPFVVHGGAADIAVLGTRFIVRKTAGQVIVSVVEGRVRVAPANGPSGGSVTITSGEIATTDGSSTLVADNVIKDVERELAWLQGRVMFNNTPLSQAAAEFNRYNVRQLTVEGPQAASIRVGGTFQAGNPIGFAHLLQQAYGLKVQETQNGATIFSK